MHLLIAEAGTLLRAGLSRLIQAERPGWRADEAKGLAGVWPRLRGTEYGVLLVSLDLLADRAPDLLRALREGFPALRIVVLAQARAGEMILACLRAGAHGVVLDSASPAELIAAIELIAAGHVVSPPLPEAAPWPPAKLPPAPRGAAQDLTARQQEVLHLLGLGRSTKEIARQLGLAVPTVKSHLATLYRILGARNRIEAVMRAVHEDAPPGLPARSYWLA